MIQPGTAARRSDLGTRFRATYKIERHLYQRPQVIANIVRSERRGLWMRLTSMRCHHGVRAEITRLQAQREQLRRTGGMQKSARPHETPVAVSDITPQSTVAINRALYATRWPPTSVGLRLASDVAVGGGAAVDITGTGAKSRDHRTPCGFLVAGAKIQFDGFSYGLRLLASA